MTNLTNVNWVVITLQSEMLNLGCSLKSRVVMGGWGTLQPVAASVWPGFSHVWEIKVAVDTCFGVCSYLRNGPIVPDVSMVGERVGHKAQFPFLSILQRRCWMLYPFKLKRYVWYDSSRWTYAHDNIGHLHNGVERRLGVHFHFFICPPGKWSRSWQNWTLNMFNLH